MTVTGRNKVGRTDTSVASDSHLEHKKGTALLSLQQRKESEKQMGGIFALLAVLLNLYSFLILVRVLMTWIPNLDPYNPIVQLLIQATDPVMEPARRLIPPIGMIDISPIVVLIALRLIGQMLQDIARQF